MTICTGAMAFSMLKPIYGGIPTPGKMKRVVTGYNRDYIRWTRRGVASTVGQSLHCTPLHVPAYGAMGGGEVRRWLEGVPTFLHQACSTQRERSRSEMRLGAFWTRGKKLSHRTGKSGRIEG